MMRPEYSNETAVLHIVPESAMANTYHGTYKDIISRVRWFEATGLPYRQIQIQEDAPAQLVAQLVEQKPSHIFIEYTYYPNTLRFLRGRYPKACIVSRAINAEALQHINNLGWWPERGPLWMTYGVVRLLASDWLSVRLSDYVMPISKYITDVYWKWFPGRATVITAPYFTPEHVIPDKIPPSCERRIIACMPTSQKNRKSLDLVNRFIKLAETIRQAGAQYEFVITGDLSSWNLPAHPFIRMTGMIDDLRDFYPRVRAVAMTSPLNFGFNTTIADALAAGAYVFVHPRIARRCPDCMRPGLITVPDASVAWLQNALGTLERGTPPSDINPLLRSEALATWEAVMGCSQRDTRKPLSEVEDQQIAS